MKPQTMKAFGLTALLIFTSMAALSQDLPDGPGKDLVSKTCSACHTTDNFTNKRHTREDWKTVVNTMIGYGAELTDEQVEIVVSYLAKNFGKEAALRANRRIFVTVGSGLEPKSSRVNFAAGAQRRTHEYP